MCLVAIQRVSCVIRQETINWRSRWRVSNFDFPWITKLAPSSSFIQIMSSHNTPINAVALNDDRVLVSWGDNGSIYSISETMRQGIAFSNPKKSLNLVSKFAPNISMLTFIIIDFLCSGSLDAEAGISMQLQFVWMVSDFPKRDELWLIFIFISLVDCCLARLIRP